MEIDVTKYLTDGQLREIAEDEARACVRGLCQRRWNSIDSVVSNAANLCVWDAVDERFGEDAREALPAKVADVIANLKRYDVFHDGGEYVKETHGQRVLNEVIDESRDAIRAKVAEIVDGLDADDLKWLMRDAAERAFAEWLRGKGADA